MAAWAPTPPTPLPLRPQPLPWSAAHPLCHPPHLALLLWGWPAQVSQASRQLWQQPGAPPRPVRAPLALRTATCRWLPANRMAMQLKGPKGRAVKCRCMEHCMHLWLSGTCSRATPCTLPSCPPPSTAQHRAPLLDTTQRQARHCRRCSSCCSTSHVLAWRPYIQPLQTLLPRPHPCYLPVLPPPRPARPRKGSSHQAEQQQGPAWVLLAVPLLANPQMRPTFKSCAQRTCCTSAALVAAPMAATAA